MRLIAAAFEELAQHRPEVVHPDQERVMTPNTGQLYELRIESGFLETLGKLKLPYMGKPHRFPGRNRH